jgi:hypothetical protein
MKSSLKEITTIIGTAMDGGVYAGRIMVGDQAYALVVAPKAEGEHNETSWHNDDDNIEGAKSYFDGLSNTDAMAEAGSELAQWARTLTIAGHDDWYLPSQDELEIIYRNLKPTIRENSCYARSGINLSAIEPTRPYTEKFPLKTQAELFQEGGSEAFETEWYWSSTQHASVTGYAWCQGFSNGGQCNYYERSTCRARAVRRLVL